MSRKNSRSDKVRKLNSERYDVLSIPNYVIEKGPSHGRRHGNTERQRIYHAAHVCSRKAVKKGYKSIPDRFLKALFPDNHSWISGGLKITVYDWMGLQPRTIPTSLRRPNDHDAKTLGFSCLTVQDRTDP